MDKSKNLKLLFESWEYLNEVIVEHKNEAKKIEWVSEAEDSLHQNLLQNMGISFSDSMYLEVSEVQDKNDEYNKISNFLNKYLEYYAKNNNVVIEELNLKFINFGKTELVYVLMDNNGQKLTLLVKQPIVELGDVYQEMQYLLELKKKDKNVIAPIDYFRLGDQELYVTPYINQARCVASNGNWGMYVPEPFYRFEPFTKEQESIVNTCMISKLVSLYDFEKKEGISSCKLGGGDFMLPKGWENKVPTIENTLEQLYLIAARKKVKCTFEEYLQIIKNEFSKSTINEDQSRLIINLRGRVPMNISDIEDGINLGKSIIASNDNQSLTKKVK